MDIAYDLPVNLRNFYYRQLGDIKEKESKKIEEAQNKPLKR